MKVSFDWLGPYTCQFCPCCLWYGADEYECQLTNKEVTDDTRPGDTRPDWCPLEEVYS